MLDGKNKAPTRRQVWSRGDKVMGKHSDWIGIGGPMAGAGEVWLREITRGKSTGLGGERFKKRALCNCWIVMRRGTSFLADPEETGQMRSIPQGGANLYRGKKMPARLERG